MTTQQPPAGRLGAGAKSLRRAARRQTFRYRLEPRVDAEPVPGQADAFTCGEKALFDLTGPAGRIPYGWIKVQLVTNLAHDPRCALFLRGAAAASRTEGRPLHLTVHRGDRCTAIAFVPPSTRALQLHVRAAVPTPLRLARLQVTEITKQEAMLALLWDLGLHRGDRPLPRRGVAAALWAALREGESTAAVVRLAALLRHSDSSYGRWIRDYDLVDGPARAALRRRAEQMPSPPLISVVMPVYNVAAPYLTRALQSVVDQIYPHWELCVADDCSTEPHVAQTLAAFAARDRRIKVTTRTRNGHISAASNTALAMARGDFVALLDHDDELAPHALLLMAEEIAAHPEAGVLFSDEDKLDDQGRRHDPYFKGAYNPDLLLSQNVVSHLGVYRRSLVEAIGGFREGYEGSQDYDLVLRASERLRPDQIRHVPHVLYHWRAVAGSTARASGAKPYAYVAAERALADHLKRRGLMHAKVRPAATLGLYRVRYALPRPAPLTTIVIPTRDRPELLERCLTSLLQRTHAPRYEVLVVDNQSRLPATRALLRQLSYDRRVRVLRHDAPFNFSAINNAAVAQAQGEVLLLLNNDIEATSNTWLAEMVSHALRPEVGAVGAHLRYPDGTVQHAGVVFGVGGIASHAFKHAPSGLPYHFGRAELIHTVSAVTGACLATRRALWDEVGGLDEALGVAYNDLDYCLKLGARGYRSVYTPYARLVHCESASRSDDRSGAKRARLERESAVMRARWGAIIADDPHYNANLSLHCEGFHIAFPPRHVDGWRQWVAAAAAEGDGPRTAAAEAAPRRRRRQRRPPAAAARANAARAELGP